MKTFYFIATCLVFASTSWAQDQDRLTEDTLKGTWESTGPDKKVWTFENEGRLTIEGSDIEKTTRYRTAIHNLGDDLKELLIFADLGDDDELFVFVARESDNGELLLYRIEKFSELNNPRRRRDGFMLSFHRKSK